MSAFRGAFSPPIVTLTDDERASSLKVECPPETDPPSVLGCLEETAVLMSDTEDMNTLSLVSVWWGGGGGGGGA